jgi:hypothetical protein
MVKYLKRQNISFLELEIYNHLSIPLVWSQGQLKDISELCLDIHCFTIKRLNDAMVKIMQWIGSTKNASQHKARH